MLLGTGTGLVEPCPGPPVANPTRPGLRTDVGAGPPERVNVGSVRFDRVTGGMKLRSRGSSGTMLAAPRTETRDASAVARFESSLAALSRAARSEAELAGDPDLTVAGPTPPPRALSAAAAPLEADTAPAPANVTALPVSAPTDTIDPIDELDLGTELRGSLYLLGALLGPVLAIAALVG